MEENYYEKINNFVDNNKKLISFLSPTFSIYNYSRRKDDKEYNKTLANNTKRFFIGFSLYIILLISIYNLKIMTVENNENLIYRFIYMIMCIIVPYIFLHYIILRKYGIEVKKNSNGVYEKVRATISKFIFSDNISIVFNTSMLVYILIMFTTNVYKGTPTSIKLALLLIGVYIFGISRPIQFFIVFIRDMVKKTYKKDARHANGKIRLVMLAIVSLVNLIFDYTILFYILNTIGNEILNIEMFSCNIETIIDMVYYTCGFGDIRPESFITKVLVMVKDISIFILITGNLGMYLSIESTKNEVNNN